MPRSSERKACLLFAACLTTSLGCTGPSLEVLGRRSPEFLSRNGQALFWQGQPFRFLGFNAFSLTGCGTSTEVPSDQELDDFFASLRPRSVVRTYAFAAYGVASVERAVSVAKKYGHFLNLVLTDGNGTCGDAGITKVSTWYETDFRNEYLPWVSTVVARFKDDPTVGMWEIVSMPTGVDALTLRTFYDVVGGEIHRIDPNHLVESGTHGPWAYGGESNYALIHESAGIDVAGFHDFDNQSAAPPNLAPSLDAVSALSKPVVIDELGMYGSSNGDPNQELDSMICISWSARRDVFERQLSAAFATSLAGVDVWNWLPSSPDVCGYTAVPEDPLVRLVHDFSIP